MIFFGISCAAFVFLYYYDWRVQDVRKGFLKNMDSKRFHEIVDLSLTSVSSLLSFSAIVLSIWAGFGLLAEGQIAPIYREDVFMIVATASLCLIFFAIAMYIYHLCHFMGLEKLSKAEELKIRKELFTTGEIFFTFGTVFFLLTFLYSFVTMSVVLSPSEGSLMVVIIFGVVAIAFLILVAVRKVWRFVGIFRELLRRSP